MAILITLPLLLILTSAFLWLRIPVLTLEDDLSSKEKFVSLENWLGELHNQNKFNGSVLLAKDGEIVFSKSYGYNSFDEAHLLTQHSSYNLASVSKQFTAMGIVLLQQQLKLDYSDKLSAYIPEFSHYQDITLEHLLHHTSGLPDYMQLAFKHRDGKDLFKTSDLIALYERNQPALKFDAGSQFEYSNTGYVLLAEIIERVSGASFQDYMDANLFKPLQMNDTQVFNLLSEHEPVNRVYGFKASFWFLGGNKRPKDLNYFDGVAGDGAVYSSPHDLFLWSEALKSRALTTAENHSLPYQPGVLTDGSKTNYGFGWFINDDQSVEHAGGWQGFSSYIYRNNEKDELIVVLDNSSNPLRVGSTGYYFNSIGLNLQRFFKKL